MLQTQTQTSFSTFKDEMYEARRLSSSSALPMDKLGTLTSTSDYGPNPSGRGRQQKFMESAQQRQERLELIRRTHRLVRNHVRNGPHQVSSAPSTPTPSMSEREWELYRIENQISVASNAENASKQLTDLLQRVKSLQTEEPRVMGICIRLTKAINQLLLPLAQSERFGPLVWIEKYEKEQRRKAAIGRIRSALAAHNAQNEVAQIMHSVVASRRNSSHPIPPSSLKASLVRIEAILGDAILSRYLRLYINARIVRRLFTTALASSSIAPKPRKFKPKPLVLGPPPSAALKPDSVFVARRMDSPFVTTFAGSITPVPSFSPSSTSLKLKWVNTVKPLDDSDSDDYGDFDYDAEYTSSSATSSSFGSSGSSTSSLSSSPQTPLDAAFSPRHSRSNSIRLSTHESLTIGMRHGLGSETRFKSHTSWLSAIDSGDEQDDLGDLDDLDEKLRAAAREEALKKLCRASTWVQSIRNAEPIKLTKRKKRISVIPKLLTVGEERECED